MTIFSKETIKIVIAQNQRAIDNFQIKIANIKKNIIQVKTLLNKSILAEQQKINNNIYYKVQIKNLLNVDDKIQY